MDDSPNTELPRGPGAWRQPVPGLAAPPRTVPAAIQWQLLQHKPLLAIGGIFTLVSLGVFIVPQLAAGNRFESAWQFLPLVHLTLGLVMVIVPLTLWRRRVAVLKWGRLAPARIVAIQDQGTVRRPGEDAHGVRNTTGPWLDYDTALSQARRFWTSTLPAALPGSFGGAGFVLGGMGCFLRVITLFAVLFTGVWLAFLWLSDNPADKKVTGTLFILGFMAVFLGGAWVMRLWTVQMKRFASGELPMSHIIQTAVHARIAFSTPEGGKREVEQYIDLRPRLERYRTSSEDLVVYLPDEPRRVLVLGGTWPPLAVVNGEWARQPPPTGAGAGQGNS